MLTGLSMLLLLLRGLLLLMMLRGLLLLPLPL